MSSFVLEEWFWFFLQSLCPPRGEGEMVKRALGEFPRTLGLPRQQPAKGCCLGDGYTLFSVSVPVELLRRAKMGITAAWVISGDRAQQIKVSGLFPCDRKGSQSQVPWWSGAREFLSQAPVSTNHSDFRRLMSFLWVCVHMCVCLCCGVCMCTHMHTNVCSCVCWYDSQRRTLVVMLCCFYTASP